MKTALRLVVGALALAVLSTGMASRSDASATTPIITAGSAGIIAGGGASFPNAQYQKWITDITALGGSFGPDSFSKLVLTYTASSSGTGKTNFRGTTNRTAAQMFSGTDSLVSSSDTTATNTTLGGRDKWTQIPVTAGPIAVITNLPGVTANIKLDGATICKIYSGEIKVWNHADILALNPTIKALQTMTQTIIPVARDATSGTTFIFASFLATAAGNTTHRCSYRSDWLNTVTSFPTTVGAATLSPADAIMSTRFSAMRTDKNAVQIASKTGNSGVRDYVNATSYSIGYVEMAFSYATNVRQAAIKNAAGTAYLLPTQSGANAAIAAQNTVALDAAPTAAVPNATVYAVNNPVNPSGSYLQPVNQTGSTAYPIVGYSWVLLYTEFNGTIASAPTKGQVEGLIYFLNWGITKGAVYTAGTTKCYSPLPASVKALVITELKKVKYSTDGTTYATVWR